MRLNIRSLKNKVFEVVFEVKNIVNKHKPHILWISECDLWRKNGSFNERKELLLSMILVNQIKHTSEETWILTHLMVNSFFQTTTFFPLSRLVIDACNLSIFNSKSNSLQEYNSIVSKKLQNCHVAIMHTNARF